jgi:nicotinate-nucleotide adenylyltransferase
MRTGIFGGTFDPPHLGHLILAQEAQEQLSLDRILWVVTSHPPHKNITEISLIQDRVTMVLIAISGNKKFYLSRVDIDRPAPHFAVDTVALLREKYPHDQFYYLMGADSLNDLLSWHDPARFVAICNGIGVMMRIGESVVTTKLGEVITDLDNKLHFLVAPMIDISGTEIRKRVESGRQFRYLVPEKVYHYILKYKLYHS